MAKHILIENTKTGAIKATRTPADELRVRLTSQQIIEVAQTLFDKYQMYSFECVVISPKAISGSDYGAFLAERSGQELTYSNRSDTDAFLKDMGAAGIIEGLRLGESHSHSTATITPISINSDNQNLVAEITNTINEIKER